MLLLRDGHIHTPTSRSTSVFWDIGDPTQIPERLGWESNPPAAATAAATSANAADAATKC